MNGLDWQCCLVGSSKRTTGSWFFQLSRVPIIHFSLFPLRPIPHNLLDLIKLSWAVCLRWWQNLEKKIPLYLKRKLYIFFVSLNPISRHENRTLILLWFWFQTYHWDKVLKQHWRHPCTLVHFWNHRLDHNCCFFKEMIPQIVKYYWITRLKGGFTKGRTTKIKRGSTKDCHFSNPLYLISLMVRKKHQMDHLFCNLFSRKV